MRDILSFPEAHSVLEPYYALLVTCIEQSFQEMNQIRSFASNFGREIVYEHRTKASMVHDHLTSLLENKFSQDSNIEIKKWNGIFAMKINENLFIRFNKINERGKISCSKTKQYLKYSRQQEISGIPEEPTFLFAGYLPDKTWSSINGIYISCPYNEKSANWTYQVDKSHSVEQLDLFNYESGRKSKVKLKSDQIYAKYGIQKNGTENI